MIIIITLRHMDLRDRWQRIMILLGVRKRWASKSLSEKLLAGIK
jgi:hypothetical protein